jgi:hypothetical protein
VVDTGESVRVALGLETYEIVASGLLRHVRPRTGGGFLCGVSLTLDDLGARQSYLQLLIPVSAGCTLAPVGSAQVRQDEPGVRRSLYMGESDSRLTVWSRGEGARTFPFSFEFAVGDHLVRGREGTPGVQTLSRVDDRRPRDVTGYAAHAGDAMDAELKRLFRWTALNFRSTVPASERKFLLGLAG